MEVMKPKRTEELPEGDNWIYQKKFDGSRVLIKRNEDSFSIETTRGHKKNKQLPEITLNVLDEFIPADTYTIDGEIVDERGFNKLNQRLHTEDKFKIKQYAKRSKIKFYIFDILSFEGEDLTRLSLKKRLEKLEELARKTTFFSIAKSFSNPALWEEIVENGYEGVVAKRLSSSYEKRRSGKWLKKKVEFREDVKIIEHEAGKDTGTFITELGRVNCPSQEALKTYKEKNPTHLEVSFLEKTENGLRFPVLERFRWKDE